MFSQGIILSTASITRVLDGPNCFDNVDHSIPLSNALSLLTRKNNLPMGALKKVAIAKFKDIGRPPKKEDMYADIARKMKCKDKKKKKDPLDADKDFLLGLVQKFEKNEVNPEKVNLIKGAGVSGHAKQVLGYLNSRETFWEQI